ncbi:DUF305 domain-containing protein [Paractinoplanes bogorensis]|uniref:DUF305 domain-containing protein n=1 Tax=Paractinoplanes bogorensis TaxID=1610840 RepID=UPI0027E0A1E0|nr:DUF305 domain-containing protein [Actinoplanes bogorensis]
MGLRKALVVALLVSGCSAPQPETPAPAFNATDVMFLQMALAQVEEGDQVAALAEDRAGDPALRTLATELRGQWREESGTMERWLVGWQQPLEPDPLAGAHAGHGDVHSLRPSDIGELEAARGKTFDRTAVTLLLGHLGNCVETARMETAGGLYPPARTMGETVTSRRQAQVRTLLKMVA